MRKNNIRGCNNKFRGLEKVFKNKLISGGYVYHAYKSILFGAEETVFFSHFRITMQICQSMKILKQISLEMKILHGWFVLGSKRFFQNLAINVRICWTN